ncbi:uncharacterized protein LOC144152487 [Haemaphysalis longicornis]
MSASAAASRGRMRPGAAAARNCCVACAFASRCYFTYATRKKAPTPTRNSDMHGPLRNVPAAVLVLLVLSIATAKVRPPIYDDYPVESPSSAPGGRSGCRGYGDPCYSSSECCRPYQCIEVADSKTICFE